MFDFFSNISFVHPYFLLLLLLLPAVAVWYYFKHAERYANLKMSTLQSLEGMDSLRGTLRFLLPVLRALAFIALVIALARPQETMKEEEITAEGIDIMLVMDLSSSMLARDFKPDRLEVSKTVAMEFVDKRMHDRLGLVVFSGEAFSQCPLTTDHGVVKNFLAELTCGIMKDGTAIGMGLATAVNRLKDSKAKSKVVILLTDGDNNAGYVQPMTAAEIAREYNVKVYTIGIGTRGKALAPTQRHNGKFIFGPVEVNIDEELLTEIAQMTGGRYYRAESAQKLDRIYGVIDKLEKTKIEVTTIRRYSEAFHGLALAALLFLCLEILLRYTIFRTIP